MNINVTRNTDQILNIDPKRETTSSGIQIEKANFIPREKEQENLEFIMNEDAKFQNDNNLNNSFESTGDNYGNDDENEHNSNEYGNEYDNDYSHEENTGYNMPSYNEDYGDNLGGLTHEEIEKEKAKYLSKLYRLSQNPQLSCRRLTHMNSLDEIKSEVFRCEKDLEIIQGVHLYRNGLIFLSSGMEFGMDKGMGWNTMNGWSHVVTKDVNNNNYDKVLEEIYEIWGGAGVMRPEFKLLMMLGSSAFNFHLQKLMAEQAMGNPNMMAAFAERMAKGAKMRGPSEDTDEILRKLEESDVSSVASDPPPQPKKRGRKKKTTT